MNHLIAVTTPSYVNRAKTYFGSVALIRSAQVHIVLLDFTPETDPEGKIEAQLRAAFPHTDFRKMDPPPSMSHWMVQDSFLNAFPELEDDDLVCLTDMDIRIQRDLRSEEWAALEQVCDSDTVAVWWNGGDTDTLEAEGWRIGLRSEWSDTFAPAEGLKSVPCMNCGVQFARASVFRRVQKCYDWHYEGFYAHTDHRSRCQFLLNWCWWKLGLKVALLPPTIHCHSHFRSAAGDVLCAAGTEQIGNVLAVNGDPIVFLHNF